MKKHIVLGRILVFAGLILAVLLGVAGIRSRWANTKPAEATGTISELDRKARPHFEEAVKNIPATVAKLTEMKTLVKLCWLEVTDKASGGRESQKLVLAILEKPILDPCRRGAAIYECGISPEYARRNLAEVGTGAVTTTLYATAGLALEAVFAKTTLRSMESVLRGVTAKLSSSLGTGAACAAADGPLPIGDALGVTLAIGGTVLSLHDLKTVQSKLPDSLTTALRHSVEEYWNSCRLEAAK